MQFFVVSNVKATEEKLYKKNQKKNTILLNLMHRICLKYVVSC